MKITFIIIVIVALWVVLSGCRGQTALPAKTSIVPGSTSLTSDRDERRPTSTTIRYRASDLAGLQRAVDQVAATLAEMRRARPGPTSQPSPAVVEIDIIERDDGHLRTTDSGSGTGVGATTEGGKIDGSITGSAPTVNLPGGGESSGGGVKSTTKASGFILPPVPWANPIFYVALLCLAGCAAGFYLTARRFATVSGVAGVILMATAFYPVIWIFSAVAIVVFGGSVYAYTEYQSRRKGQAAAAMAAGVDDPALPPEVRAQVKARVAVHSKLPSTVTTIDLVKRKEKIGKYAPK